MLPKKERASSFIINKVFKSGYRVQSPMIDLVYVNSKDLKTLFAVSVSKKAIKNSVDMHKSRRRVYSAISRNLITSPQICVFIVKKTIKELSCVELKKVIHQLIIGMRKV